MILSFAACASDKSGSDTTAASDIKTDAATAPAPAGPTPPPADTPGSR